MENNEVSKIYSVGVWNNDLESFKPYLKDTIIPKQFKNVGVLTNPRSGAQISHHHYLKHEILNTLLSDSKYLIIKEPICLMKGFVWGIYGYFLPQGDYVAHIENLKKIFWWNYIYNICIIGQIKPIKYDEEPFMPIYNSPTGAITFSELFLSMQFARVSWVTVLAYIGMFWFSIVKGIEIWKTRQHLANDNKILIFLFFNFGFYFLIYSILGSFENNRLRFELIGLEAIIIGLLFKKNIT